MDQRVLVLSHDLAQARLAVGERDAFLDDLRAQRARRGRLRRVGVLGNEDQCRNADCSCCERHCLRMIARAHCDDAARTLAVHQGKNRIECSARLERAGHLKALGLQSQVRVELGGQDRGAADVWLDAIRGRTHRGETFGQKIAHTRAASFSRAASWRGAGRLRMLVSTMPKRITTMPTIVGRLSDSCRSTTPQKTAVTGTMNVTPVARTGPSVFIV